MHKNHNSPEFFSEGAELANQEVPLPARMDMLWSFTWCPQDAFEKAAITLQSVNKAFLSGGRKEDDSSHAANTHAVHYNLNLSSSLPEIRQETGLITKCELWSASVGSPKALGDTVRPC